MDTFAQDQKGTPLEATDLIKTTKWRFRPAHQWYFDAQRKGGSSRDIQLLGGKIDWMGGDWWYLQTRIKRVWRRSWRLFRGTLGDRHF